ncbi:MAG: hypothetical protein ACFB0C_04375 [Leptolyngbyaceae cyanobacterium]
MNSQTLPAAWPYLLALRQTVLQAYLQAMWGLALPQWREMVVRSGGDD